MESDRPDRKRKRVEIQPLTKVSILHVNERCKTVVLQVDGWDECYPLDSENNVDRNKLTFHLYAGLKLEW